MFFFSVAEWTVQKRVEELNYFTEVKRNYNRYAYLEADKVKDCSAKRIFSTGGIDKFEFINNELLVWVKSETQKNFIYSILYMYIQPKKLLVNVLIF